ncbi:MAG: hypothetical protein AAF349_09870 [Cyanobacteria bacterium P01_A01_bin.68]
MNNSLTNIQSLLSDPTITKLIEVAIGIVVIAVVFRLISQSLPRYIQDSDTRYRTRKTINFIGYIIRNQKSTSVLVKTIQDLLNPEATETTVENQSLSPTPSPEPTTLNPNN